MAPIRLGADLVERVYLGSDEVDKIYLGTDEVYSKAVLDRTFQMALGDLIDGGAVRGYGKEVDHAVAGQTYFFMDAAIGRGDIGSSNPIPANLWGVAIDNTNISVFPLAGGAFGALPRPGELPATIRVIWGNPRWDFTLPLVTPGNATRISRWRGPHGQSILRTTGNVPLRIVSTDPRVVAI